MNNGRLTNRQLAESDPVFVAFCKLAGVFPSRTRYRRYKHKRGRVYEMAQSTGFDKEVASRIGDK